MINFARISRPFLIGLSSAFCLVFPQASAETVETQQKVNSLAAIVIGVSDIESAMAFYTSVIGLELVREVNADEYLERILEVPGGQGTRIVLFQSLSDDISADTRIVFYTNDAGALVESMRQRELEVVHAAEPIAGTSVIVGIAKDANGTMLEFIQLPKPTSSAVD